MVVPPIPKWGPGHWCGGGGRGGGGVCWMKYLSGGAKRVLRVRLQHVDPRESRPEALNAPCFFNLRHSNKTNSSEKMIFTVKWSHSLVESRSDNFKLFEKVYLSPSTCHSAIFTEKVQIYIFLNYFYFYFCSSRCSDPHMSSHK
jgi:hypothetical protein